MALCNILLQLAILAAVIVIASAAPPEVSDLRCGGGCEKPKDDCSKGCEEEEEEEEEDDGGCGCGKSRKSLRMPATNSPFSDNRQVMPPLLTRPTPPYNQHYRKDELRMPPTTPPISDHRIENPLLHVLRMAPMTPSFSDRRHEITRTRPLRMHGDEAGRRNIRRNYGRPIPLAALKELEREERLWNLDEHRRFPDGPFYEG